jgi:hypothetical protein
MPDWEVTHEEDFTGDELGPEPVRSFSGDEEGDEDEDEDPARKRRRRRWPGRAEVLAPPPLTPPREFDFTETERPDGPAPERSTGPRRTIGERRESMRGLLAGGLTVVFAALVLGAGVATWVGMPVEAIKAVLEVLLPPVVALTGTALGFYFGEERASSSD